MRTIANTVVALMMIWALGVSFLAFLDITIHWPWIITEADTEANTLSSPSNRQNWSFTYIFILWRVAPHWKKPRILSPAFSHHIPFLYGPIRSDYLLQT